MARRELRSTQRIEVSTIDTRRLEPRTKQAFLALDYPGSAQSAFVQFTDPNYSRTNVLQARLRPGLAGSPLPAGTPVTVQVNHGQIEIISLPGGSGGAAPSGNSQTTAAIAPAAQSMSAVAVSASSVAAPGSESLTDLPELPDDAYPPGTTVTLVTDGVTYRNVEDEWVGDVDTLNMPDLSSTIGLTHAAAIHDPSTGVPILHGNTNPNEGDVGAQPFLYNEWKRLIRNGDFHDPPPDPSLPIDNDTNALPGWRIDTSDPNMAWWWVPDTTTGSGGRVELRGDASSAHHSSLLGQPIPIRSSTTRNNALALIVSGKVSASHALNGVEGSVRGLDSTGFPTSGGGSQIGPIIGSYSADNTVEDLVGTATSALDADAQTAYLSIGNKSSTSVASSTWTFYEVQLIEFAPIVGGSDIGDPTNAPWTAEYDSGLLTITADSVAIPGLPYEAQDDFLDALSTVGGGTGGDGIGFVVRQSDNSAAARILTAGAGLSITHGNGVGADPVLDRAALTGDTTAPAGSNATTTSQASGAWALPGDITPTQLSANTDNWNPTGLSAASVIRASSNASRNLTGIAGGADGRILLLLNVGTNDIVLKHDVTSTAANRFFCHGGTDQTLPGGSHTWLIYDSTSSRWRTFPVAYGTPTTAAFGDAATAGTVPTHRHGMPTAAITTSGLTIATATVAGRATAGTGAIEALATTGTGSVVLATGPTVGTLTTTGSIELGNASDTTISRSGAGAIQVEGVDVALVTTGTWTPALAWSTPSNSSWANSVQIGHYTKISNTVFIRCTLTTVPTNNLATGLLTMTGLPFASLTLSNAFFGFVVEMQGWTRANYTTVHLQFGSNSTAPSIVLGGSGQNLTGMAVADVASGGTVIVRFSGHYEV